ncbi:MAG: LLM class flavin-dependent oxidoreductase [Dehalococcoidia bacterium]|nr:LLM class flavin-dependent oxidoreductase [Dehalococcoidia bacterium]
MATPLEIWSNGAGVPKAFARRAAQLEQAGFDGVTVVDSQNLAGDCYVALALAAHATERIRLATGVTNPFTRHAAVTASAIATVQAESNGRAMLGIGRGDSALAHLGHAPVGVPAFETYIRDLQTYLRGEEVPFAGGDLEKLRLAGEPTGSRIAWLRASVPKVPVDVAATGPKVIAAAARHADRITFAVGADVERIRWGMEVARGARKQAGLDPEMPFGAYVTVIVHDDPAVAKRLGEGGVALFARFSAMHGHAVGPVSDADRRQLETIHDAYDMNHHAQAGSQQAATIGLDFAERFAILGPVDHCIARLRELVALGLDRLVIVGPSIGADRAEAAAAEERFVEQVMPALR